MLSSNAIGAREENKNFKKHLQPYWKSIIRKRILVKVSLCKQNEVHTTAWPRCPASSLKAPTKKHLKSCPPSSGGHRTAPDVSMRSPRPQTRQLQPHRRQQPPHRPHAAPRLICYLVEEKQLQGPSPEPAPHPAVLQVAVNGLTPLS